MTQSILRGMALLTCFGVGAALAEEAAIERPMLPAGSLIRVRLKTTLSDKTNKTGDPFTALVIEPVVGNGEEIIPAGSVVNGHVAFVKESGRVKGVAEMRLVADTIALPEEDIRYNLSASLEDAQGADCQKVDSAKEGTIKGCGKTAKQFVKGAAIGGAIGGAAGLSVGLMNRGGCSYYYGCWPSRGPGVGASVLSGAGIGAGTALIWNLFKHNKHIILVQGAELTFVINRSVGPDGTPVPGTSETAATPSAPAAEPPPKP